MSAVISSDLLDNLELGCYVCIEYHFLTRWTIVWFNCEYCESMLSCGYPTWVAQRIHKSCFFIAGFPSHVTSSISGQYSLIHFSATKRTIHINSSYKSRFVGQLYPTIFQHYIIFSDTLQDVFERVWQKCKNHITNNYKQTARWNFWEQCEVAWFSCDKGWNKNLKNEVDLEDGKRNY